MDPLSIALALGGTLLGGLLGGGGRQQPDVVTMPALDEHQQQVSGALAQALLQGLGQAPQAYGGAFTPQPNRLQALATATLADLIGNPARLGPMPQYTPAGITPAVEGALTSVLAGRPAYDVDTRATEQLYRTSVEAPALRMFREQVLPETREQFAATPGMFWSSARQQAEAKAASDLAANLAAQRGQLVYADEQARREAWENAAQRQASVVPAALQYALTGALQPFQAAMAAREQAWREALAPTELAGQLGQQQAALEQQGLQMQYQDWLRTQAENNPFLQLALSYLGVPLIAAYQPAYQPNPWAQLLGVGGNILAGMAQAGAFNNWRG